MILISICLLCSVITLLVLYYSKYQLSLSVEAFSTIISLLTFTGGFFLCIIYNIKVWRQNQIRIITQRGNEITNPQFIININTDTNTDTIDPNISINIAQRFVIIKQANTVEDNTVEDNTDEDITNTQYVYDGETECNICYDTLDIKYVLKCKQCVARICIYCIETLNNKYFTKCPFCRS